MEKENNANLTTDASCCMEIAGIESMIEGMDAPTVASMMNQDTEESM